MAQLGKCLRNKGASKGVTVYDGCQAFSPKPKNPQRCEACGCHASFHQRLDIDTGVVPGGVAPWIPLVGVNVDEVPIIPRRSQAVGDQSGGERGRKGGRIGQRQTRAEQTAGAVWGGAATAVSTGRLDPSDGATSGGAAGKSRYCRKGDLTIAETAAQLGVTVEPNYPGEGKPKELTIAQIAALRGVKLGAGRHDEDGGKKGKRVPKVKTIAERAGELGLVLPDKVMGAGGGGSALFGRGGFAASVVGRGSEWASVVDLTEGEATRSGAKRRTREELAGPAKKARVGHTWMQSAPGTSGQSPSGRGTTGFEPRGVRRGAGLLLFEVRGAPMQQGEQAGSARKGKWLKESKTRTIGWEEAGTGSASKYTAFGDGIGFARQMLADFLSNKKSCEKDLAFKEVGPENKHLTILRSQLDQRTVSDTLDARSSTKKVIAYLAKDEKERVELSQPLGTIRVVMERPFDCERRPAVTEWLEGRSISTHVAELSYLYTFPQYRNGAVTIPLFAYIYLKILKPAGVNCVLLSVTQTQVERYFFKHLSFLGFEFIENFGTTGSVLAVNLEKAHRNLLI
ncbi:hypothetical protein KFL_001440160 [Klebsormidium nitens]|uniref:ZF-HD dimerization-type domain-containing protein n=1 Tax=Klebsormidium nitens TaxID=105231 RepID=A0A1Y1I5D0_KLENI|nr:hypothetical protein KFL_001440160 [Klebsormidium nitens]|eukprot:GAQ83328.1 hypothetical protein KFL_001440160 [Klebsormidium nitens]